MIGETTIMTYRFLPNIMLNYPDNKTHLSNLLIFSTIDARNYCICIYIRTFAIVDPI